MTTQQINVTVPDAQPIPVPAAGFKSTEFTSTVVAVVAIAAGLVPPQYAPIVASLIGVYAACRTVLKAVHALGYAKAIPDLPAAPALPQFKPAVPPSPPQP